MPNEVRVFAEGALRWAQASGSATTAFSTASACTTALVGYVQAGLSYTSAQRVSTITDRGTPNHHKVIGKDTPVLTIEFLEAITANNPALMVGTASGASTPMVHFEIKSNSVEDGAGSATYRQFLYCVKGDDTWTEQEEGNPARQAWYAIHMYGPTASGYIA